MNKIFGPKPTTYIKSQTASVLISDFIFGCEDGVLWGWGWGKEKRQGEVLVLTAKTTACMYIVYCVSYFCKDKDTCNAGQHSGQCDLFKDLQTKLAPSLSHFLGGSPITYSHHASFSVFFYCF